MAMTKAEKADMDRLRAELRLAVALRWSGHKAPQMIPPPEGDDITHGFLPYFDGRPKPAWSRNWNHGFGDGPDAPGRMTPSRGGVPLYVSERDVLIALRQRKEREAAWVLADIDDLIDKQES